MALPTIASFISTQEETLRAACDWLASRWGKLDAAIRKIDSRLQGQYQHDERGRLAGEAAVKVQAYWRDEALDERVAWATSYAPTYTREALALRAAWGAAWPLAVEQNGKRVLPPGVTGSMLPPPSLTAAQSADLDRWAHAATRSGADELRAVAQDAALAGNLPLMGVLIREASGRAETDGDSGRHLHMELMALLKDVTIAEHDQGHQSLALMREYRDNAQLWRTAILHADADEAATAGRDRARIEARRSGQSPSQGRMQADGTVVYTIIPTGDVIGEGRPAA